MNLVHVLAYVCVFRKCGDAQRSSLINELPNPLQGDMVESFREMPNLPRSTPSSTTVLHGLGITKVTVQPPRNPDCDDIATAFVYNNNLCLGASNPKRYMVKAKSRYTCHSRCGQAPSLTEDFSECGCDELCTAFRDCCHDMEKMCPQQYSRRNNPAYPPRLHKLLYSMGFNVIFGRAQETSTVTPPPRVTPASFHSTEVFPLKPKTLQNLALPLWKFHVVDLATRLMFHSYTTYKRFSTKASEPVFIPKVAGLECTKWQDKFEQLPNVEDVLSYCRTVDWQDVMTPYHRPVKTFLIQRCRCGEFHPAVDHVHNYCLGQKISQNIQYRFPLWDIYSQLGFIEIPDDRNCSVIKATAITTEPYKPKQVERLSFKIRMRVTPHFHHYRSNPIKTLQVSLGDTLVNHSVSPTINSKSDLEFFVEFTDTLEQNFLCPSLQSYLKDCRLQLCAAGALLWVDFSQQRGTSTPRHSCILPTVVRVSTEGSNAPDVNLCTCLQVLAVLNGLGLWRAKIESDFAKECVINLITLPTSPFSVDEINTFTEPGSKSTTEKNQVNSTTLSKLLTKSRQFCHDEIKRALKVCFESSAKSTKCLTVGRTSTNHAGGITPNYWILMKFIHFVMVIFGLKGTILTYNY